VSPTTFSPPLEQLYKVAQFFVEKLIIKLLIIFSLSFDMHFRNSQNSDAI